MLHRLRVKPEATERVQTFLQRDDLGEERLHVQPFFLEDADGWHHGVLPEIQADDLGRPARDLVRDNAGRDGRVHAEGQHLSARGDALERLLDGIAGRLDDDIRLAPVSELGDILLDVIHVWVPDRQPAFLRHADAEWVDLGHGHFRGDVLGELREQVTDGSEADDQHVIIGQHEQVVHAVDHCRQRLNLRAGHIVDFVGGST